MVFAVCLNFTYAVSTSKSLKIRAPSRIMVFVASMAFPILPVLGKALTKELLHEVKGTSCSYAFLDVMHLSLKK